MSATGIMSRGGLLLLGILLLTASGAAGTIEDDGRIRGRADAPLTLIEYSDYTCGYCLKFFKETLPKLQATYIDTGKVKFVYRDYPRADRGVGVEAAVAARCAGAQGQYWAMHDRLFGEGGRLDSLRPSRGKSLGVSRDARIHFDANGSGTNGEGAGYCDPRRISVRRFRRRNRSYALQSAGFVTSITSSSSRGLPYV